MAKAWYLFVFVGCLLAFSTAKTKEMTRQADIIEDQDPRLDEIDRLEIMNACNETFRTEMSFLETLNKSGSFPDETDRTPKCFMRCVLEKCGVLVADALDAARAAVYFAAERGGARADYEEMAVACSDRNETCKCDMSYQYVKCVIEMEINQDDNS